MKTLGIKFQVAGIPQAQAGLNGLRNGINQSLNQNKQAIANYQRDVKRGWNEWKTENFGTTAQKQNLTIRQERREFAERSTYKQLSQNNRALVLEFRLAYQDFFTRLEKLLEDKQNTNVFEKMLGFIGKPIGFAVDAILFPFQSALAGAFERMGEVQVQDFSEGFNKSLQRALGLSFEETGGDVGKVIGTSLYKVYQKSIDAVNDYVKGKLQFNLADTLIDAFKHTVKTLAKELPALALRTHRRIQIDKKAIPEARKAAGLRMIANDLPEAQRADIEANKSISLVYGGANTDSADIGKDYVARVMKPYLKGSAVIPMTRQWTNSAVDSEFQGDVKNLIKLILSNPAAAQTFKGFVSENGLSSLGRAEQAELLTGLDVEGEIDLSSIERMAEIVESLMSNKDFSLGKALQATFKGFNPDDIAGAAEAIALMEQFPDKDLQIGGFSQGGYNALGVVDLLNRMGYDKVKGFSIGTPITGANATVNPDNFRAFMGDKDYYYNALTGLAGDNIDFPEFFEVGEKEGALHSLQGYVRGDNLKGGLQAFLGDRVSLPSDKNYGKHDSAYGYAVGELGAETALIRTLLTYLGESKLGAVNAKEGFIFSAEETLPGYTNNLKRLSGGLKDEDTKAFHAEYIDFLETLQKELEIAEQLAAIGKQYKPLESLAKAAKIFPVMETMAAKHTNQSMSGEQLEAAQTEAAEKEKLVFFQRKVKQQKDNIERTFQAMLGRNFSKKDEAKGIYSFYNPEEYDERANNFEGMVNWLENDVLGGASQEEMATAQPTLDLLKKIATSIRETGSTGQFDLATARDAEQLLGIDLKEFNLLFKEFEGSQKEKIDVNQYKDELRTLRRNRDQILTEKKTPQSVAESLASAREKITAIDVETVEPLNLNTQQLQGAFSDYLQEIIRKGTEYGTNVLRENATEIEGNFNEAEITRQFNQLNEEFKKATKEYRQAVNNGNSELATELAENLLFQSASLKRIYGELVGQIRSEDTAKSMRGFTGYLTGVQTEITSGQPNLRGRVATGLPAQIASSPELEATVRQIDFGSDIRAGVEKIINRETGEEIGYQFVLGINEGGQNAADIQSPSRVWQWIGEMIKSGFEGGVTGIGDFLTNSLNLSADTARETMAGIAESVSNVAHGLDDSQGLLDSVLDTEGADEEVNSFFGDLVAKVSEAFDDLKQKFPILGKISDVMMDIGGEVLQVLGLFSFGEALIQFSTTALATAMQMEGLERSIIAVSDSAKSGANNIRFVREEARRLSIDLVSAQEAYKRILGATRNTPLEGLQTEKIFSTLAATARNRGLTTDATNRLFLGFEQVIAKNEFKSEEVRGQLAEVLGDIQNLLATATGVPLSQLSELMEAGSLKAPEVMPKLLALLDAQNAALGDSSGTAAASWARLNNAILEYQDAVGRQLQPVQKLGLDSLAAAFEVLRKHGETLVKLSSGLIVTVLVNLTLKLLATKLATFALGDAIYRLGFALGAILPKLAAFLARFILITAAIEVWNNNRKLLFGSFFPEMEDRLEASTKRLEALEKAFKATGLAAKEFGKNQPKLPEPPRPLELNEGPQVPKWLQGLAGGERLNMDNLLRNRLNKLYGGKGGKYLRFGPLAALMPDGAGKTTTAAEAKQADFVVNVSQVIDQSDATLKRGSQAKSVLEEIALIDAETRQLQSQRLNINSGDTKGLRAALAAEKAVLQERDKLQAFTAQYQESLQGDIQDIQDTLLELDELDKTGGNKEEIAQRKNSRAALEERLKLLEAEKEAIEEINGRIPKFIAQVDKLLRNSDERVQGFVGNQEDSALVNRTAAIKEAIALGLSDADLELRLDNLSASDLEARINLINSEIKSLEDKLGNAYLQEGVQGLERAAASDGLELTTPTLQRMLEEGRNTQETEAAKVLLALDGYQGMLAEAESGLVDLVKSNQGKLRDFNKTVTDYFSRMGQQIKEAKLETERLLSQIMYGDIKNKLRGAIAPGSNNFVNGVVENIQSLIDSATQIAEKNYGDLSAQLSFELEVQNLAIETQEFIRSIGSAGEALQEFVARITGDDTKSEVRSQKSEVAKARLAHGEPSSPSFLGLASTPTPRPPNITEDPQAYANAVKQKFDQYVTGVLKQPAGAFTGIEQMAGAFYSNSPVSSITPPVISVADPAAAAPIVRDELVERKNLNLQLQRYTTTQQRDAHNLEVDDKTELNKRQIRQGVKESQRTVLDLQNKLADLESQYDYKSAGNEAQAALRNLTTAFLDADTSIENQILNLKDMISTITKLTSGAPEIIAQLKSIGTPEALKTAAAKEASLAQLQESLPKLRSDLALIQGLQTAANELETQATEFTTEQGDLNIEVEDLNKKGAILGLKTSIAAQAGTLEEERVLKIEQEKNRLATRIAEIKRDQKPGTERDELIEQETRQSLLNQSNINYDKTFKGNDLFRKDLEYRHAIDDKKAGFLARFGFNLQADKIRRESAIATEKNRYQRELLELEQTYQGKPKTLERFTQQAKALNQVNLQAIDDQFKSLGTTVEDLFISSTQGFFSKFVESGFDFAGQREKAQLEERLRYAEELVELENQYRETPGQLAHMKNRARELNEEKLDKIKNEFNLFSGTVNLAKQAILEFIKQLAAMAAQQAAAKFISSVLNFNKGGTVPPSGGAIVNASAGATIGKRKLSDHTTKSLRRIPAVARAWSAEGSGAQLGVFHVGEELLSRKTGEAGRYQGLKQKYGINPLQQLVNNYSSGGTIPDVGTSILSGFSNSSARLNLSGLERQGSKQPNPNKTINFTQQIFTPNADSFRLNADQRNQDLIQSLKRRF